MTLSIPYARNIRTALLPALVLATMVTTGCATVASNQSSSTSQQAANPDGPNVSTVLESPESHQKSSVRWGGTVVAVENRENATWIEVVERPLNREGRPVDSRLSNGRFLAIVPEFLDPADYRSGRAITVSGSIDGSDTRKIGDAAYDYPKVVVADHQLWTSTSTRLARYSPVRSKFSIGFGHRGGFGFRSRFGFHGHRGFRSRGHFRGRH